MGADPREAKRAMASYRQPHDIHALPEMPFEGMAMQHQPTPMHYAHQEQQAPIFMPGARGGGGYNMPAPQLKAQVHPQLWAQIQPQLQVQIQPQVQSQRYLQQVQIANQELFFQQQLREVEQVTDFKKHKIPLARIKKVMKTDPAVQMIAFEAPLFFSKACEMFVLDITRRSWDQTERNGKRTLQKTHIAEAAGQADMYDFLVDILDSNEEVVRDDASVSSQIID